MLTTFALVESELKGTDAKMASGTEQQVMRYVRTVSRRIQGFGYFFEPYYETKEISGNTSNVDSKLAVLTLSEMLLEVQSIVVNNITLSYGTDIIPYPNNGQSPVFALRIVNPRTGPLRSWYPYNLTNCDAWIENIAITGFWGMRTYYSAQGFFLSGVTCPAINAGQAFFVVSDVAGPDIYNRVPLFSPGNLIRIDNELMEITKVDTTTKTLYVLRGMNGTAADSHVLGTAIKIWEPEQDIMNMATRQAALLYARRGSFQQMTTLPEGITITYPADLLMEIKDTVHTYQFVGARA